VARTHIQITANSEIAQKAIDAIGGSWIKANAVMNVVENMFNKVAGAANKVTQVMRDQGKFFSAVKDDMALAAVQIGMSVTDGMIEPMALAKQANVLMRGDLKLSQDQFNAFAKAAVEIGRATGEDTEAIFDRLTKGALKGSVEAMEEYGIRVDQSGTKTQRSARIVDEITKRYGGLSIAAQDAGEVMDSTANKTELQLLMIAKQTDGLSQTLSKFKNFYITEFVPGIVDALAGTKLAASNAPKEMIKNLEEQWRIRADSINLDVKARDVEKQKYAMLKSQGASYADLMVQRQKIDNLDRQIVEKANVLKDVAKNIGTIVSQNNLEYDDFFKLNSVIAEASGVIEESTENIGHHLENHVRMASSLAIVFESRVLPAVKNIADMIPVSLDWKGWALQGTKAGKEKDAAAKRAREKAIQEAEQTAKRIYEIHKAHRIKEIEEDYKKIVDVAIMEEDAIFLINEKYGKLRKIAAGDAVKLVELEYKRVEEIAEAKARIAAADAAAKEKEKSIAEGIAARQKDLADLVESHRTKRAEEGLNKRINLANTEAEAIALTRQKFDTRRVGADDKSLIEITYEEETAIDAIKDKFAQKDLERRKAMIAAVKDTTVEASNVMLQALTADAKAREGLGRTDYMMKQLSAWMKAQALKHAAQSVGALAEAAAAYYLNPPAVGPALRAAALHAAAATAFGGASMATSAMAGSGKSSGSSSSSSSSASSTTQREAVGGTAEQSRGTVNIVIGGRGVLFGNPDELARKLSEIMNSANRRGRI
jgi:hypothetical protein